MKIRAIPLLLLVACQPERPAESTTLQSVSTQQATPKTTDAVLSPPRELPYPGPLELLFSAEAHTPEQLYTPSISARAQAKLSKEIFPKAKVDSRPCYDEQEMVPVNASVFDAPYVDPLVWYIAEGSFTEPTVKQTLYLLDARECGRETGTTVVAIYTGKELVGASSSPEYRWISRILDINQDGLSEILFYNASSGPSQIRVGLFGLPDKSPETETRYEKEFSEVGGMMVDTNNVQGSLFRCWDSFLVYAYQAPLYGLPTKESGPMEPPRAETYKASVYHRPFQAGEPLLFIVR